ncbi:MAG TPA: MoaD/ThiS family protein [Candidatus Dormibacteraeota bacterium]|jgi:molybdopterin synthase sulfur carrier subunit|nr:MoaD/ThiS family protein [Candidatus Dormibacteraeota bacterium]
MTVRLVVPTALRDCAGGSREVSVEGATLRDVLDDVGRRLPILERRLRDERGLLRPHVLVFVDGVMLRSEGDLDTPVHDGTEVFIAPAVAGG